MRPKNRERRKGQMNPTLRALWSAGVFLSLCGSASGAILDGTRCDTRWHRSPYSIAWLPPFNSRRCSTFFRSPRRRVCKRQELLPSSVSA